MHCIPGGRNTITSRSTGLKLPSIAGLWTRSDQIDVVPKKFNGYAEVKSPWIQAAGAIIVTGTSRFDGKRYVRRKRQAQRKWLPF